MPRFSPRFFAAGLGLWIACASGAVDLRLPPITGELAGVFSRYALPGAPALRWKIAVVPLSEGMRAYALTVEGEGTLLRVSARVAANGDGAWQIDESRAELGPWLAVLAPEYAPALAGAVAAGSVTVTGDGRLRRGQPEGKINVELKDGTLRHAGDGWALEGIALAGEFSFDADGPHWASTSPLQLTVRTISTTRFGARNLLINALVDERLVPAISVARVELAGGEVTAEPFTVPLSPLSISVKLRMSRIGLQDLVALVPASLSYARGRIDGEIQIAWSKAAGVQLGAGYLALREDEPTIVRLTPVPGLLSASMPERFQFLPAWTGPLGRWLSPLNPAYADLKSIELGQVDLRADSLAVRLTPEGDGRGRSASIEMVARPERSGTSVDRVTFAIDVTGPIAALLQLGTDGRTTLKFP